MTGSEGDFVFDVATKSQNHEERSRYLLRVFVFSSQAPNGYNVVERALARWEVGFGIPQDFEDRAAVVGAHPQA